jgi:2-succinyl-5-enolpyruvyl-6-hydroxy-3-cyclohexene-1-carboxylate synthase
MKHRIKRVYGILHNITEICYEKGVRYAVLSPGSRSGPIALSFLRNEKIKSYIISDERSAGYVALGIALQTHTPVALVCTSGTAAVNYAPAVTEAYFQRIPLIVFTADRPSEWIGQGENQAIFQQKIYEPNILKNYQINIFYEDDEAEKDAYRSISEGLNKTVYPVKGPVHINVPLREPLYDYPELHFEKEMPKIIKLVKTENFLTPDSQQLLLSELKTHKKIVILAGQYQPSEELKQALNELLDKTDIVFMAAITSNLQSIEKAVLQAEIILNAVGEEEMEYLQPNLLISFGGPMISKTLKLFLRKYQPQEHWHIDFVDKAPDSYQALTRLIPTSPLSFIKFLADNVGSYTDAYTRQYYKHWQDANKQAREDIASTLNEEKHTELFAVSRIFKMLPKDSDLHLANSLPIRLGATITMGSTDHGEDINVFSNRGTSGIDGCLSTAVGSSMATNRISTLIIGDMSFLYDRNGLWNNYLPPNLKIIILNNHGGGIFKTLDGPPKQPEFQEYFVTRQPLTLENTVQQHNLRYIYCDNLEELDSCLEKLYLNNDKASVLEIEFK